MNQMIGQILFPNEQWHYSSEGRIATPIWITNYVLLRTNSSPRCLSMNRLICDGELFAVKIN